MSIKPVMSSVSREVLGGVLHEDLARNTEEDSVAGQRDQYIRLSVNLQKAMDLFDLSAQAVAVDQTLVGECDSDCDAVVTCDVYSCDSDKACDADCDCDDSCDSDSCDRDCDGVQCDSVWCDVDSQRSL